MDFLDPEKHRRHMITIAIGYFFIALAVGMATLVLLYYAYGFSFGKNGQVIQNGLMFVASTPNPANVYLNGKLNKAQTNSRIILEEGEYEMQFKRDGYHTWQRSVTIDGGKVVHYDYPFLVPNTLTTTAVKTYDEAPQISLQSPDKRWLLVNRASSFDQFEIFDLKNPKVAVTGESITLPAGLLSRASTAQSWQLVEWSSDNRHVLVKHVYDDTSEYIMIDRSAPEKSINLTQTLGANPTELRLIDKKYDRYYLYDVAKQTLSSATLAAPQPIVKLDHVLAFKSYGTDTIVYAAAAGADSDGSVRLKLVEGSNSYTLRELPAGTSYLVDMAKYDGNVYIAASASSDNKVYVYQNPVAQINDNAVGLAVPVQVLRVTTPTYMSFSANARFVVAQGGSNFGIYDAEDEKGFSYTVSDPIDAPQEHATWMDGHRLMYVSGGNVVIFDYDNSNRQKLVADKPGYLPAFDSAFKYLFTFTPSEQDAAKTSLTSTSLRTLADR
ncbi:MAG: PEGA domain-containing protein [Candidatus Saccharimonadales bacterium]